VPRSGAFFRLIIFQIFERDQTVVALHIFGDKPRRFARVKFARALFLHSGERRGQFRLFENVAFFKNLPLFKKIFCCLRIFRDVFIAFEKIGETILKT
jgi:hypothetical protein